MNEQSSLGSTGNPNQVGQNPQNAGVQSLIPSNTSLQTNAVSLFDPSTQTISNVGGQPFTAAQASNASAAPAKADFATPLAFIAVGLIIGLLVVVSVVMDRRRAKAWQA